VHEQRTVDNLKVRYSRFEKRAVYQQQLLDTAKWGWAIIVNIGKK
jgi:hypothetical protein